MFSKSFQDWCAEHGADKLLRCYQAGGNPLPADRIGFSSPSTVTFRCGECGYEWRRSLNNATSKHARPDCPACAGRVPWRGRAWPEQYPELLSQFDFEKNDLPPEAYNTKHLVAWRCGRCRNRWTAVLGDRLQSAQRVRRRGGELCPFCGHQRVSPQYNLAVCYPDAARQFAVDLNGGLQPQDCFPAGGQKLWWRCDFDPSHVWQDKISNRTLLRRGCPHCAALFKMTYTSRVLFYYLRQVFPDCACEYPEGPYHLDICLPAERIAIEHHGYTHQREKARAKDARRRDDLLRRGYHHVLWLVESPEPVDGYLLDGDVLTYYDPTPYPGMDGLVRYVLRWLEALLGETLPFAPPDSVRDHPKIEAAYYHQRRQRSLAVRFPELAAEWSGKNGTPADAILPASSRKGIWRCAVCGREFTATVANRTRQHSGCPYCAGRLPTEKNNAAVLYPPLLPEWDAENNDKTLYELLPNTEYLAAWVCRACGHRWKTMLPNRASPKGSGCPACRRAIPTDQTSLAALAPAMAAFWHPEKNGGVTPDQVMAYSNKRWWWRCGKGHEWQGSPNSMAKVPPDRLCPFCRGHKVCADNCLSAVDPVLAAQWHPEKNGALTPRDVTAASQKKVWWLCAQGHAYRAPVYSRSVKHTGCPYCAGLKVSADNCLAAVDPALAAQWHPTKNGALTPRDVTAGSGKSVWWLCEKKHEWEARVSKRSRQGQGCPYCAGRRVSPEHCLAAVDPALAAQWHPEKNGALTPWDVAPAASRKVWWRCDKGHEWQASVSNRRGGKGCPYCAGRRRQGVSLDQAAPELCAQWHPTRNTLPPSAYLAHSNKKVWWRCDKGHEWQASPDARVSGHGCPYCAGLLASPENCLAALAPALAAEWDWEENRPLTPEQVLPHSIRAVGWLCPVCGHRWTAPIAYRMDGSGCPACRKARGGRRKPEP